MHGGVPAFKLAWPQHAGVFTPQTRSYADVSLGRNATWDLDINIGAAKADLDLSNLDVRSLGLDVGATDAKITLGDPSDETRATIKAGASSIVLMVPEGIGVEFNSKSALTSVDIADESDWTRTGEIGNRTWRTSGFVDASRRIYVTCQAGAASVEVKKY